MFGFEAPKVIPSEVFTVVPEQYRSSSTGPRSPTRQSSGGTTLEGPCFDQQGNLYFVDIPNSRVFRATPAGEVSLIAEYKGEPNGLKVHRDGRIFIADHHHGIMLLDPATGAVSVFKAGPEKENFKGVNDLLFDSKGNLYFTDQGSTGLHDPTGRVYKLSPDGELRMIIGNIPSPNGLVMNAAETSLYVAATRDSSIWLVPMTADGGLTKVGLFARLPASGPDGLAADVEGNIAVAHPSLSTVWLFNRRGIPTHRIELCQGSHPTNIAYGGPDNQWLYITEGDTFSVLRARMPAPGRRLLSAD